MILELSPEKQKEIQEQFKNASKIQKESEKKEKALTVNWLDDSAQMESK